MERLEDTVADLVDLGLVEQRGEKYHLTDKGINLPLSELESLLAQHRAEKKAPKRKRKCSGP